MAHRFGQFFLDPIWPCSDDENNPHNANLEFQEQQDNQICKLEEPQLNKVCGNVKLQFFQPEDEDNNENQDNDQILQEQLSESQSQYIMEESQSSEKDIKVKRQALVKFEYESQQQPKLKVDIKKRPKQTTKNPLKCGNAKKIKQFERGRYNILSQELKKQIVQQSKQMTMVEVAKKYNVSVNNICRWKKRCDRRSGAGRKVTDMQMQNKLLDWLLSQNHPIPRKEVQIMAKKMSKQTCFKASKGWFERFYKRNKLHFNSNIQILTHNDYRQRFLKGGEIKCKQENSQSENTVKFEKIIKKQE